MNTMKELFDRWTEIQKRSYPSAPPTVGMVQQRISDELHVLEALHAAGCSQIPGEAFDVRFLIEDRHRLLREMHDRLSQI